MKFIINILFLLYSLGLFAQHEWDGENWDKESLGFACAFSGQMTEPVMTMTALLAEKRFDEIRKALNSDVPADQFMAAFVLQKLSKRKELELSNAELKRIQEIKNSDRQVPVCSGCTYWGKLPLRELFDPGAKEIISTNADNWFDTYYKVYYQKKKRNN